MSVVNLMKLN